MSIRVNNNQAPAKGEHVIAAEEQYMKAFAVAMNLLDKAGECRCENDEQHEDMRERIDEASAAVQHWKTVLDYLIERDNN